MKQPPIQRTSILDSITKSISEIKIVHGILFITDAMHWNLIIQTTLTYNKRQNKPMEHQLYLTIY